MANKNFCDVCDEEIHSFNKVGNQIQVPLPITHFDTRKTQAGTDRTQVDLCRECIIKLRDFLGLEQLIRLEE